MKMKMGKLLLVWAILFTSHAMANTEDISIISVGKDGREIVTSMNTQKGEAEMVKYVSTVTDSVYNNVSEKNVEASGFKMKMFSVGLGLTGDIGPAVWKVGGGISHRVFFSKQ